MVPSGQEENLLAQFSQLHPTNMGGIMTSGVVVSFRSQTDTLAGYPNPPGHRQIPWPDIPPTPVFHHPAFFHFYVTD